MAGFVVFGFGFAGLWVLDGVIGCFGCYGWDFVAMGDYADGIKITCIWSPQPQQNGNKNGRYISTAQIITPQSITPRPYY